MSGSVIVEWRSVDSGHWTRIGIGARSLVAMELKRAKEYTDHLGNEYRRANEATE